MPRGGKREGAGRKVLGATRRVSLTLPAELWEVIDETGQPLSTVLRQIIIESKSLKKKMNLKSIEES